jgi:hypothetical protein
LSCACAGTAPASETMAKAKSASRKRRMSGSCVRAAHAGANAVLWLAAPGHRRSACGCGEFCTTAGSDQVESDHALDAREKALANADRQ